MSPLTRKRRFSHLLDDANGAFMRAQEALQNPLHIGFVLQEHFSMAAFTASVDALVTANLMCSDPLFSFSTYGLESQQVTSDLGIDITATAKLELLDINEMDVIIICGGFRCSLEEHKPLTHLLKRAARAEVVLGGIWNGVVPLAYADLLQNQICALHPDNHAFMVEKFSHVSISRQAYVIEKQHISCAGHISALAMMLKFIEGLLGKDIVRAIHEILSCDDVDDHGDMEWKPMKDDPSLPQELKDIIQLMNSNIEDPLTIDALASYIGSSRRHVERLFEHYLSSSPARYYLEIRITHARRLLLQTRSTITNVSLACGFVSTSHFSNCYKDYFGISPSQARKNHRAQ